MPASGVHNTGEMYCVHSLQPVSHTFHILFAAHGCILSHVAIWNAVSDAYISVFALSSMTLSLLENQHLSIFSASVSNALIKKCNATIMTPSCNTPLLLFDTQDFYYSVTSLLNLISCPDLSHHHITDEIHILSAFTNYVSAVLPSQ